MIGSPLTSGRYSPPRNYASRPAREPIGGSMLSELSENRQTASPGLSVTGKQSSETATGQLSRPDADPRHDGHPQVRAKWGIARPFDPRISAVAEALGITYREAEERYLAKHEDPRA